MLANKKYQQHLDIYEKRTKQTFFLEFQFMTFILICKDYHEKNHEIYNMSQ